VRKNPDSTSIVRIPNGATSGDSDSIQPSTPELRGGGRGQELPALDGGAEEIVTIRPERWARMIGRAAAGDVARAEEGGLDLRPEFLSAELLKESGVKVAGVVDQHVEPADTSSS
jgi:hypothetical protein